jgi:hypothetical protein
MRGCNYNFGLARGGPVEASIQIAFVHVSTDRQCRGTKAPCTSQTQATASLLAAQEGSAASQPDPNHASQAAPKQRAGTHGVVLISILAPESATLTVTLRRCSRIHKFKGASAESAIYFMLGLDLFTRWIRAFSVRLHDDLHS